MGLFNLISDIVDVSAKIVDTTADVARLPISVVKNITGIDDDAIEKNVNDIEKDITGKK